MRAAVTQAISVRKWIDPGPHILLKMSRFLLCKAMKNSKKPSRQKVTLIANRVREGCWQKIADRVTA